MTTLTIATKTTAAQKLANMMQKGFEDFTSTMREWATFAEQIENSDESSQVERRLNFMIQNLCNLYHNQMYGNRQIWAIAKDGKPERDNKGNLVFSPPTEEDNKSQSVRFSASQNLAYWEDRRAKYINEAQANGQTEENYNDDLTFQNILVREHEARLWWASLHTWEFLNDVYGFIKGEPYIYQVYNERKSGAAPTNVSALAATLIKK